MRAISTALAAVVMLMGLAGCGKPAFSSDIGRDIASRFLTEVREGKVDAAWSGTTAEFKSALGRDAFRQFVRSKKALKSAAEFQQCQESTANGLKFQECTFRAAGGGTIRVTLASEAGQWKVERLAVD